MALLISLADTDIEPWLEVFRDGLGGFDIRIYPDVGNVNEIEYVAAWKHPFGEYIKYPNLKAILSLDAGVDHIINDPELPEEVSIVRMEDNALTQDMCLYALHWTLHFHSDYFRYAAQQQDKQWIPQSFVSPSQRNIGVMGFGAIGGEVANSLASQGFCVSAWGASKKTNTGDIHYYSGGDQLSDFIAVADILINVLPLTPSTRNLVDEEVLKQLPKGAFVINMARGGIINEADLLKLFNEDHITVRRQNLLDNLRLISY